MMMRACRRLFGSLKFSKQHEWIQCTENNKKAKLGITNYAKEQLGQIVFIDLNSVGKKINVGDSVGSIESVKIASDIYSPLKGQITQLNKKYADDVNLYNEQQAENTWLVEFQVDQIEPGLLTKQQYDIFCQQQGNKR